MKRIIAILFVVCLAFTFTGCATTGGTGTTPKIDCVAAQALIDSSAVELANLKASGIVSGDAVTYWTLAQSGAVLAMTAAGCPIKPPGATAVK